MLRTLVNGAGGRIGRAVTYEMVQSAQEISSNRQKAYLFSLNEPRGIDFVVNSFQSRDPVHGIYNWKVEKKGEKCIYLDGMPISFSAEEELSKIPFVENGIEMVIECSGFFGDDKNDQKKNKGREFLDYGVKRVIETYPANSADKMLIMGVNHDLYDPSNHRIISNASCTTKALAMPIQVLIDNGICIDSLSMDTTHAATSSQDVLGSLSQIITHSTGAAKATGSVIPSLSGRMAGMSYRVPTLDGSFANLYFVACAREELTADKINEMFKEAVYSPRYAGRTGVHKGEDAGTFDIIGRRENAVIILSKTNVQPLSFSPEGKRAYLVTVISGYDNELGSSVDPVKLANYISKKEL